VKRLLLAPLIGLALLASGAAAAADLVNVHVHGLNNAGRIQIHIHNIVHNVQLLNDNTLTFDIDP